MAVQHYCKGKKDHISQDKKDILILQEEIPMEDYSGGSFKGRSLSFLSRLPETELQGHTITIDVKWREAQTHFHTLFTQ
ncbi:DUF4944 domain-containing protein [Bacillus nakamurai]|uniref:DUF4944 domain-containing protein n=1 Tax=Bacillus nakamurai TaxID=1793963 RepID=UPI0020C1EC29|nr:DUF4944 domain-containing protein [Bacillus nakamurai]MCP6684028.1 YdhH/YoaO family protein [Bacillus nakamurai]